MVIICEIVPAATPIPSTLAELFQGFDIHAKAVASICAMARVLLCETCDQRQANKSLFANQATSTFPIWKNTQNRINPLLQNTRTLTCHRLMENMVARSRINSNSRAGGRTLYAANRAKCGYKWGSITVHGRRLGTISRTRVLFWPYGSLCSAKAV